MFIFRPSILCSLLFFKNMSAEFQINVQLRPSRRSSGQFHQNSWPNHNKYTQSFCQSSYHLLYRYIMHRCRKVAYHFNQWQAIISTLIKKPGSDVSDVNNQLILNLTFMSKVIERLVCKQLVNFLKEYNLLSKYQSAYWQHHSIESDVLKIISDALYSWSRHPLGKTPDWHSEFMEQICHWLPLSFKTELKPSLPTVKGTIHPLSPMVFHKAVSLGWTYSCSTLRILH